MLMKARVGASLVIMVLLGCAAPARISSPSGKPEAFKTGVTRQNEAVVAGPEMVSQDTRLARAGRMVAAGEPIQVPARNEKEEISEEIVEYDPWEPFNQKTFGFNLKLDRYVLKPIATVWDKIFPDLLKQSLGNAFDNVGMPRRFVNNLFQLSGKGASKELARFVINTTLGGVGFFDVAQELGIQKRDADTGQTLGVYGVGPGPYLVLPFLPPLTVRDGIGYGVDTALDPLGYFIPFAANMGRAGGKIVNDRALNLQLFESIEETVLDLYTAVRSAYLQRRQKAIADALAE